MNQIAETLETFRPHDLILLAININPQLTFERTRRDASSDSDSFTFEAARYSYSQANL